MLILEKDLKGIEIDIRRKVKGPKIKGEIKVDLGLKTSFLIEILGAVNLVAADKGGTFNQLSCKRKESKNSFQNSLH